MSLEDHLGDILRKARTASGVSVSSAAKTAGLPEADYRALETSGHSSPAPNLAALASLIGLHPGKLAVLAAGWRPAAVELGLWRELQVIATTSDGNTVNCYLVWDEATREAALFDTGWEAAPVLQRIEQHGLQLQHIFLTHLHEDHVAALAGLREKFPKVHLHTNSKNATPQQRNRANDFLQLGSLRITNRDTPGHAEEGVTYLVGSFPEDAPHVALVGDTLFAGSIATGFQSWDTLKEKIRTQILSLPEDTLICPGHGPLTTVAQEKQHNPFFS